MQITNRLSVTLDFVVKGEPKDGVPPTESLAPGETRNIDVADPESGVIRGRVIGGAIEIGGDRAHRRPKE
jgi:hypothetical protein